MIIVFTGPTLPAEQARDILDAVYLPPVAQGDVYRAAQQNPQAIALIDGFFEHVPSVWHKEILWAMQQGIHVFGASSMGALRAAELESFGMEGVGAIFEAVRSGQIEDDDEVAVAHASANDGFTPLSVALVDMRATFAAAEAQGVIDAAAHETLLHVAKSLYYPRRVYPTVIEGAAEAGVSRETLDRLKAWLRTNAISQKRADALLLLETLKARFVDAADAVPPKRVIYAFQHTQTWEMLTESAGGLYLDGDAAQHLPHEHLLDEMRLSGETTRLVTRALDKQAALAQRDLQHPRLADTGLSESELFAWYFGTQLGLADVPDAADHAAQNGFADLDDFRRAVIREYLFKTAE